jgi:hypothetical protein
MSTDATVRAPSGAATRIADTLLRIAGGREVQVRIATQPSVGDGGQLGQPSPMYQDYPLAPVVFRRVMPTMSQGQPNKYELLISSTAVANLLSSLAASSAQQLFNSALGVVVDGSVMLIEAVAESEAFGSTYLYTLALRDQ